MAVTDDTSTRIENTGYVQSSEGHQVIHQSACLLCHLNTLSSAYCESYAGTISFVCKYIDNLYM